LAVDEENCTVEFSNALDSDSDAGGAVKFKRPATPRFRPGVESNRDDGGGGMPPIDGLGQNQFEMLNEFLKSKGGKTYGKRLRCRDYSCEEHQKIPIPPVPVILEVRPSLHIKVRVLFAGSAGVHCVAYNAARLLWEDAANFGVPSPRYREVRIKTISLWGIGAGEITLRLYNADGTEVVLTDGKRMNVSDYVGMAYALAQESSSKYRKYDDSRHFCDITVDSVDQYQVVCDFAVEMH